MGEKPLGLKCLRFLHEELDVEVAAVCTRSGKGFWWGKQEIIPYCRNQGIPLISRREIPDFAPDFLVSVLYPFIVEPEYLLAARKGCFNLHEAPLPRWRGCNNYSHALLAGDTGYGTSLHEMTPILDAGRIIAQRTFAIEPGETARELYERTSEESYLLFRESCPRLFRGELTSRPFESGEDSFLNTRDSLVSLKALSPETLLERAIVVARALDFVPWEPAYVTMAGERYYLFIAGAAGRAGITLPEPKTLCAADRLKNLPWGSFNVGVFPCSPRPLVICREDLYRQLFSLL